MTKFFKVDCNFKVSPVDSIIKNIVALSANADNRALLKIGGKSLMNNRNKRESSKLEFYSSMPELIVKSFETNYDTFIARIR